MGRIDLARELRGENLSFVFVAVIPGNPAHDRPAAVSYRHDGERQPAVCGTMHGVRQTQITGVPAGQVEVDLADDWIQVHMTVLWKMPAIRRVGLIKHRPASSHRTNLFAFTYSSRLFDRAVHGEIPSPY